LIAIGSQIRLPSFVSIPRASTILTRSAIGLALRPALPHEPEGLLLARVLDQCLAVFCQVEAEAELADPLPLGLPRAAEKKQ
jgi:hypothetical protein